MVDPLSLKPLLSRLQDDFAMTPKLNDPEMTVELVVLRSEAGTEFRLMLEARKAQRSGVLRSKLGPNSTCEAVLLTSSVLAKHLGHLVFKVS